MNMRILLLLLACSLAPPAWSYNDVFTHPNMSRIAFDKSRLTTDPQLVKDLGLISRSATLPVEIEERAPTLPPREILAEGARLEDSPFWMVRNHFYDPVYERPLFPLVGEKSPDWALEDRQEFLWQDSSFRDARNFMYQALTAPGAQAVRDGHWGNVFLSLGHVIHHVQDMAQPQHVRHDIHLQWDQVIHIRGSRYEHYTRDETPRVNALASSRAQAVFPGPIDFKLPRDFWFKAPADGDEGIAQFANHRFLSADTNFLGVGEDGYALSSEAYPRPENSAPPTEYTLEQLYLGQGQSVPAPLRSLCDDQGAPCSMLMYPTQWVSKASTLSIFDQDLEERGLSVFYDEGDPVNRIFALNRFNFDAAHEHLIPAAVSYSAGLLNYFFRGRLEIEPPELGAYAYADHTAGEGFSKIRAKIRNITPFESLEGGTVEAVVKFRRNECYEPDLSGEFSVSPSGEMVFPRCDEGESFVTGVFITKSRAQSLTLMSGQEREVTFTFPEPIPFNATDVYLQVIYRGKVGEEVDSIAVGTEDISEPTFSAISNAADVFVIPDSFNRGTFHYWRDIRDRIAEPPYSVVDLNEDGIYASPPDVNIEGADIHVDLYLDGGLIGHVPALPEGRFARIALLLGSSGNIHYHVTGNGFDHVYSDSVTPRIWRVDWERGRYDFSLLWLGRNELLQAHAAFFFHYYRVPPYDSETLYLKPSLVPDAIQPLQATMVPMATGESVGSRGLDEGLLAEGVTPGFLGHPERRGTVSPTGEYFEPAGPFAAAGQPAFNARFESSVRTRMGHLEAALPGQVSAPAAGAPPGR